MVSSKGINKQKVKQLTDIKHGKVKKIPVNKNDKKASLKVETKPKEAIPKTPKFAMPSTCLTENVVIKCLEAIEKINQHQKNSNRILEDEVPIFAELHCMKIQNTTGNVKFVLPHSTVPSTGEVCLITPDLKKGRKPDHEPTIEHWEELLQKAGVTNVKTILPMRQLRVEYDQFELKRRLLTQHDFIMVDTKVLNHVSHVLGKMFFKKHNMLIPVRVDTDEKKLKKSIDTGLRTAMLRLNIGETSTITVGHTGMDREQLKDNVLSLVQQLKDRFPGGENNIRGIFLKLPLSMSVPLYLTLRPSSTVAAPKLVQKKPKNYQVVEGELTTILGGMVSVNPDGTVQLTKKGTSDDESEMEVSGDEEEEEPQEDDGEKSD